MILPAKIRSRQIQRPVAPRCGYWALLSLLIAHSLPGQAAPGDDPATQPVVELDPFDVTSVATNRYQASNTISGTAMNTPLKDVPMSINVITSEFLNDAIVGSLERALDFNSSVTQTTRGEVNNQNAMFSLRGFRNRNILLDGVMGGDHIPRYLIDRIEVVKGPNTLYGQSDPGGLVNMISKRPRARNHAFLNTRFGSFSRYGADIDVNAARVAPGVSMRVLASHESSDGFHTLDGTKSSFGAFTSEWKATASTRIRLLGSLNRNTSKAANRGARPFMIVPTDLNGDGDTVDIVRGLPEATARYNSDFLPWEFTPQTKSSNLVQEASYVQLNIQQSLGSSLDLQYNFMRSQQENDVTFREFNTFSATGNVTALYQTTNHLNVENAHTLNALVRASTGPIRHSLIAGARRTMSKNDPEAYQLRPGTPAERAALNALEANGRTFRHVLTKADILAGAAVWKDDAPTGGEIRAAGFRTNQSAHSYSEIKTFYLSDSFSMFNERLRILAGLRRFEVSEWGHQLDGSGGSKRRSQDTSYQIGANYSITKSLIAFANQATSYNPNGFDVETSDYFPPEESEAIEVGLKLDGFWAGRLSGSIAWFNIDKVNVVRSDYNPFEFRNTTEISDDRSEGIDLEVFLNLTPNWQTIVGYTHLNARTVASKTEALGLRLEGAAPDRLTFFTTYSIKNGSLKGLRFGGGAIRAWGPIQQFGTSNSRLIREDGYTQVNLFARYATQISGRSVTFGINVSNLTDEYFLRARGNANTPREIVGSINFRF